jgi:hypothetical protein
MTLWVARTHPPWVLNEFLGGERYPFGLGAVRVQGCNPPSTQALVHGLGVPGLGESKDGSERVVGSSAT